MLLLKPHLEYNRFSKIHYNIKKTKNYIAVAKCYYTHEYAICIGHGEIVQNASTPEG